jgi:hypothetical protein
MGGGVNGDINLLVWARFGAAARYMRCTPCPSPPPEADRRLERGTARPITSRGALLLALPNLHTTGIMLVNGKRATSRVIWTVLALSRSAGGP